MSKILNFYTVNENGENVDRTWFDSSTVKYAECIDKDNDLKTLRVTFNNGTQYEYKKINVNDYLLFREDASAGKGLNKFIKAKNYEYEKLENSNIQELEDELSFRMNGGLFLSYDGNTFKIKDKKDNVICNKDVKLTEAAFNTICSALESVGKQLHINANNFIEDEYNKEEDLPFEKK